MRARISSSSHPPCGRVACRVADQQRNPNNQKVNTSAVFGGVDWDVTPLVTVQGSVRYTQPDREYRGCTADGGNGRFSTAFGFLSTVISGSPATIAPGACITLDSATGRPAGLLSRDHTTTTCHGAARSLGSPWAASSST